jgi:hypothetical protein
LATAQSEGSIDGAYQIWRLTGLDVLSQLAALAEGGSDTEEGSGVGWGGVGWGGNMNVIFHLSM